jgi:hypothetical protein
MFILWRKIVIGIFIHHSLSSIPLSLSYLLLSLLYIKPVLMETAVFLK